jgi:hypothetical protein
VIEPTEIESDVARHRQDEIARVARELAGYGFYVMDALLPDDIRARPIPARTPAQLGPEAGPGGRLGTEDAQVLEQDGQAERDEGETP